MSPLELFGVAARTLHLGALALLAGGALAPFLARRAAGADPSGADTARSSGEHVGPLERVGRRWRALGAGALLAALAALLAHQAVAFRDPFEPFLPQIGGLLLRTDWGRTFSVQALLAVGLALPTVRRRPAPFALLAALSAASLAFAGHAWAVSEGRLVSVSAEMVHAVAAAVWLGGLGVLVWAARTATRDDDGPDRLDLPGPVSRFSSLALVAVPLLFLTGAAASWIHGGGPAVLAALTEPGWGRALAVKIGLVAAMAGLGFHNWRVTLPALRGGGGAHRFGRGPAAWEALLGAAVLVATAVLVALSPPSGG